MGLTLGAQWLRGKLSINNHAPTERGDYSWKHHFRQKCGPSWIEERILAGHTLPFPFPLHPCVGETISAIKCLTDLARPFGAHASGDYCDVGPINMNVEFFI